MLGGREMMPKETGCEVCDRLWGDYAHIAERRLGLIQEQERRIHRHAGPLGLRIQSTAEAQMRLRVEIAAHERKAHPRHVA